MSVAPTDLLEQAKKLADSATNDPDFRNVVGRAYYAAYHAAQQFHSSLPQPGIVPAKATGAHDELCHRLVNPAIPKDDPKHKASRIIGIKLRDFHRMRVKADYVLNEEIKIEDALDAISRADAIFALVEVGKK